MPTSGSYVKFLRGTESAFNKLTTKDNDTLYFVYTSNDASKGSLWLGNKQIVTGTDGSGSVTTEMDLNDLKNVLMSEAGVKDKDILSYDVSLGKWINRSIDEIVAEVMTGATAEAAGKAGLVPAPQVGDQNKFLRGDGNWAEVPVVNLTQEQINAIPGLITTVGQINGDENTEGSFRQAIKQEVTNLIGGASEAFDTLKEIQDWITTDGDATTKLITRVSNLETAQNEMTLRIDNLDARLQWGEMKE